MKICVLFLHHEACALTRFHFALLSKQNAGDTFTEIVPVSFPEYQSYSLLPRTWIAEQAAQFRSNPSDVFHRFHHAGGPLIPDLDCLVWDFVLHSGRKADRIILVEGDMLARCGIRDFFNPSFEHEISGSVVRRGIAENRDWWWYDKAPEALRDEIGEAVASITPVCGIQMSWDLAERMARMVL